MDRFKVWIAVYWWLCAGLSLVVAVALHAVLTRSAGQPSVPLDDAYIHFQFARAFSQFSPFEYTQGAAPAAGATSLLWPLVLAPFFWLGVDSEGIIWAAWFFGFLSLGLLVLETLRAAQLVLSPLVAIASSCTVLCFGGLTWLAASGMEAVPFAWLWLLSARKLAELVDAPGGNDSSLRLQRELVVLSWLTPLMRPEGSLVPIAVAVAFSLHGARSIRKLQLLAFAGVLARPLCFWLGTGQASSTTGQVKWLPNNPYLNASEVMSQVLSNLNLLYTTLFNGELWSASVLPEGGAFLAWCALPALLVQALRKQRLRPALVILICALGIWIPTTYDTFLWNRLRYLWPFAPAWFIALGALCDLAGDLLARYRAELGHIRLLLAAAILGAIARKLPTAVDDLAESSMAIRKQQVSLGLWAHSELPATAIIGVNDTGAVAYFSGRQTFDIVGLTTRGEGIYWNAGAGSRFEHYERLHRSELPTHFIVYPEWFALDPLLGKQLTERNVAASILGGTRMVAYEADYSSLGSAELPHAEDAAGYAVIDSLDVADLQSERTHGYALFEASRQQNSIASYSGAVDGMRLGRTRERFWLDLRGAELLVARVAADLPTRLSVTISGRWVGSLQLSASDWQERVVRLPVWARQAVQAVEINAPKGGSFGAMHYWALGRS